MNESVSEKPDSPPERMMQLTVREEGAGRDPQRRAGVEDADSGKVHAQSVTG